MPGIVGIIDRGLGPDVAKRQVSAMVESMMHESFYVSGMCSFVDLDIHGGWIAHEDSMAAGQVFWNERQDVALLLAGECFTDPGVRLDLKRAGHDLGERAGDWLVHLYEEKRERFFESLDGLFSGLLLDLRHRRGYLFNDRYGIERLYWFEAAEATYFATEAKALLRVIPELRTFDEEGVADFLAFGCTLEWRTLFKGMRLVPGASLWKIENGECRRSRYFDPAEWESLPVLTGDAFQARFQETFARLLPRYFVSESKVGISLTGGLDTRMIMACLPETATTQPCYTFVGETGPTLDARLAAQIANAKGLQHQTLRIESDFLPDFGSYLDRTISVTDGCAGATGSHEIYFNARARQLSSTRLTGNFGGEIFRSISTFKPLGLQRTLLGDDAAPTGASEKQRTARETVHPVTFAAFREIPWNLFGLLAAGRSQLTFRTPYLDNELVALAYRAPASLRRSPVPALELIRSASPELACVPTDRGEVLGGSIWGHALRRSLGEVTFKLDYYHKEGLPPFLSALDPFLNALSSFGVLGLHKFLPYCRWFRNELAPLVLERISSDRVRCAPWWAKNAPELLARAHISGRGNYQKELNAVLSLEAIDRLFFSEKRAEMPEQQHRVTEVTV